MLRDSKKMLLFSLLGLFVLSSTCSASYLPNMTKSFQGEGSGMGPDFMSDANTVHWPGAKGSPAGGTEVPPQGDMSHWAPGPGPDSRAFPIDQQWQPNMTMVNGPDRPRMILPNDSSALPVPNTAICDMLFSAPVPPSIDQIPFFCICSYCKGTLGPKGDRGDRGPPGMPGSPGNRGLMGFKGVRGFTGLQGIKGQKGDLGEKGQPGVVGFTGTKGDRGFKGDKGDQGLMGPPGEQGPQGQMGTCPATCESIPGPSGPQGPPGPVGARGLPGVNGPVGSTGAKGDKGDMGVPGVPGSSGQKGNQGDQGICRCTNGTDGQPGAKGSKGDKGDQGPQGIQGLTGSKGDIGNMGIMGPPGPCSPAIQAAFSASLNQSFPMPNWPVAFHQVFTNQLGVFNPSMGMFTAPVNGTYVFSFSLTAAEKPLKAGLFRNFYPIVKVTETANLGTVSQTIVLHLAVGDRVWMQVKDIATNGMYTDAESTSSFSGYLLNPDACDVIFGRSFMPQPTLPPGGYSWDGPHDATTPHP